MSHICKNAQEEALKGIEQQMYLSNYINALRDLHYAGGISSEKYIEELKKICNIQE
jgi:hypothetical protein